MRVVSVNVGLPREVAWHGRVVRTSIWKEPVEGSVHASTLNLEGDRQSDLSVHGGPEKAVYAYPAEHYEYWRRELQLPDLARGAFGENLTIEGLLESQLHIGDRLRVGAAEFQVTQPRVPCFKLGVRFDRDDMVKRFLHSGRSGFYLAVVREGDIAAGQAIEILARDAHGVTVAEVATLYARESDDPDLMRRVIAIPALPEGWKSHFRERLVHQDARGAARRS